MSRITLSLSENEKEALIRLAEVERRHPRDQGALLLRRALEKSGYLTPASSKQSPRIEVSSNGAH